MANWWNFSDIDTEDIKKALSLGRCLEATGVFLQKGLLDSAEAELDKREEKNTKVTKVTIVLNDIDAHQAVSGLECRVEIYQRTADMLAGREYDVMGDIEDCKDEYEAQQMVDAYQRIIDEISKQIREQK